MLFCHWNSEKLRNHRLMELIEKLLVYNHVKVHLQRISPHRHPNKLKEDNIIEKFMK